MRSLLLLFSVMASSPANNEPICEAVDLIEVNHFYDEQGRLVFDQAIFYEWSQKHDRYMIRAWRLVKNKSQLPQQDHRRGGWLTVWHDGEILRRVWSQSYRESFTQYDPELAERDHLPKEQRRELLNIKIKRKTCDCPLLMPEIP